MIVAKVNIIEKNQSITPAFYIHNDDFSYTIFVDINNCIRHGCHYTYIDNNKLEIK